MTLRRLLRRLGAGLAVVLLLAVVAAAAGVVWLRGSLPQLDGSVALAGLEAPAEVLRDADGVVTIRAQSEQDAFLALGFVHAQDRLWQMDFMRRTGAGRLSEVVGPPALGIDRLMRGLGFYRLAEAQLDHLSDGTRFALEAYAAGVNAFLDTHDGAWPPEFYLLRYRPEPWRVADSLVWGRLMALQLSSNWWEEVQRQRLLQRLTPQQVDFLWPPYPDDAPVTLEPLAAVEAVGELARVLPWSLMPKQASNSWVVAGERTASGRPVLANDPHLALDAPGLWYLVRIETPELTLAGATTPGVPFLIAGHNGHIAWGYTTTEGDTQDLFAERLSEGDPERYDAPDGPRPFAVRQETIAVRGEDPLAVDFRATRHGPVVSDLLPETAEAAAAGHVLALAWPALREDDATPEALYQLNRARDWPQFRDALSLFHSPQQNVVYADRDGHIGFIAPARVPLRASGDGRDPVPGWSGAYDWTGFIPFDDLPQEIDPARGRIVAANNKIVPDDYPYLITRNWPDHFRARRIVELLDAQPLADVEASQRMQLDVVSLAARQLLPLLLDAAQRDAANGEALERLAAWDHAMDRERPEPLLFYAWLRALTRSLLADELGPGFADFDRPDADLVVRILEEDGTWCDDVTTEAVEDCPGRVTAALGIALAELEARFGGSLADWRWGEAHRARFPHPVLSYIPLIDRLFGFAVEADGGSYTLNRAGLRFTGPEERAFEDVHGPGYRAIYDLADLANSRFMIATGQSGNPLSPLYGSLAEPWRDGRYLKMVGDATAARHRLRLNPG